MISPLETTARQKHSAFSIDSPFQFFGPPALILHHLSFIVPAAVGAYTIRPHDEAIGTECAAMEACFGN